MFSRSIVVG